MSSNKRRLLRIIFTPNVGCGCGRPKLSDIFQPRPKAKAEAKAKAAFSNSIHQKPTLCHSSSSSWDRGGGLSIDDEDYTSTTFSLNIDPSSPLHSEAEQDPNTSQMVSPCRKIGESVAVMKDSDDPYNDFRHSMLQMVMEKELYSRDDLQELLNCFLQLNSPCHHDIIVRAFTVIWNEVISSMQISEKPCVSG